MSQVPLCATQLWTPLKIQWLGRSCIVSFIRNILFLQHIFKFPWKNILNFIFFACVAVVPPSAGMSAVRVCTQGFWSSRPLAPLLCRPNSLPCVVSEHVSCIHPGYLPWLSSSTHQHCLLDGHLWPESCGNLGVFIIQRPCSLCCFSKGEGVGREQRCVFFGRERCRADTVSLTGRASKSRSRLPPHYLFQSGKAQARSHREQCCVRVCVCVHSSVCPYLAFVLCLCVGNVMCSLHELAHSRWAAVFVCVSIGRWRAEWSRVDLMVQIVCVARLSLTCHIAVCYYWPWQVRLEKAAFIEPDWKFIHKKSIPLIRSTHLWFTPICIYPKHRIKSMKLITRSCCLCADTHARTLFPFANSHNEQHQMSTAFSPPSIPPGRPTLHTLHTIFMPCLRMRIHGLVIWTNPGNHWLSLVLMKGNNSLTCAKTVQKQPFLMSDTSRPPDAFYVSNSLIKQHPGERDRGHMKCVRECVCA